MTKLYNDSDDSNPRPDNGDKIPIPNDDVSIKRHHIIIGAIAIIFVGLVLWITLA